MKAINIIAPNIKSGGGKELLEYLLEYIDDNHKDIAVNVYVDASVNIQRTAMRNVIVMTSEFGKIILFFKRFENAVYFGNLPPIRKSKNSIIYFHNTYLLMNLKKIFSSNIKFLDKVMCLAKQFFINFFVENVDFIVCQTDIVSKQFKKKYSFENIKILPFYRTCKKINLKKKYDYCYISLAHPHKNHQKLFDALKILEKKKLYLNLAVTVEANKVDLIRSIQELNKNSIITIVNFGTISKEKVCELYASSKCLIFPSLEESFGLPLIEAIDMGLDVLSSDLEYVYEVINPSLSFNPNDVQSIADTIQKFNEGSHPKSKAKVKDNISELLELILKSKTSKINNENMYI
jgi:glycosyltransferase involved in cell wall biosynthesis